MSQRLSIKDLFDRSDIGPIRIGELSLDARIDADVWRDGDGALTIDEIHVGPVWLVPGVSAWSSILIYENGAEFEADQPAHYRAFVEAVSRLVFERALQAPEHDWATWAGPDEPLFDDEPG